MPWTLYTHLNSLDIHWLGGWVGHKRVRLMSTETFITAENRTTMPRLLRPQHSETADETGFQTLFTEVCDDGTLLCHYYA